MENCHSATIIHNASKTNETIFRVLLCSPPMLWHCLYAITCQWSLFQLSKHYLLTEELIFNHFRLVSLKIQKLLRMALDQVSVYYIRLL